MGIRNSRSTLARAPQLQRPSLHPEPQSQPTVRATVLHQVDSTLQSNMTRPAPAHHNLHRTWATNANASGTSGPTQQSNANVAPAVRRSIEEPMREQPWNGVGNFAATLASSFEEDCAGGGETGSNSAAAGTDEREGNMTENL